MAEHCASAMVNAPIDQVYVLFSHFDDFPKFMHFVEEVTYRDDQRSHWVAKLMGRHAWDAVNEGWIDGEQIGWRSVNGLENVGRVVFRPLGPDRTQVEVRIAYNPPASLFGDTAERLGVGKRFEQALQRDLDHFARLVSRTSAGALDPASSSYIFRGDGATVRGHKPPEQDATMETAR